MPIFLTMRRLALPVNSDTTRFPPERLPFRLWLGVERRLAWSLYPHPFPVEGKEPRMLLALMEVIRRQVNESWRWRWRLPSLPGSEWSAGGCLTLPQTIVSWRCSSDRRRNLPMGSWSGSCHPGGAAYPQMKPLLSESHLAE